MSGTPSAAEPPGSPTDGGTTASSPPMPGLAPSVESEQSATEEDGSSTGAGATDSTNLGVVLTIVAFAAAAAVPLVVFASFGLHWRARRRKQTLHTIIAEFDSLGAAGRRAVHGASAAAAPVHTPAAAESAAGTAKEIEMAFDPAEKGVHVHSAFAHCPRLSASCEAESSRASREEGATYI